MEILCKNVGHKVLDNNPSYIPPGYTFKWIPFVPVKINPLICPMGNPVWDDKALIYKSIFSDRLATMGAKFAANSDTS